VISACHPCKNDKLVDSDGFVMAGTSQFVDGVALNQLAVGLA